MPGVTSSSASPNSRYMSSRQTSPSSRQWPRIVAKFSARSRLNCMRWALNSVSASTSLITPDMPVLLLSVARPVARPVAEPVARPVAEAVELGGDLVEAQLDDIRIFRHAARGDVLDPAAVRDVDALLPHDRVDGRGQRRQEAVDLPVPGGDVVGDFGQHGPQRVDGGPDGRGRHRAADALERLAVGGPDRLAELALQVRGGVALPGAGQEAGQPAHLVPVAPVQQGPGQRDGAADHLGPEQAGLRVHAEQPRLRIAVVFKRDSNGVGRKAGDARQPGRLQQLPGQEQQVLALRGQLPGPLLVFGQQEVGEDGRLDGMPEGQVGGRIHSHKALPKAVRTKEWRKEYSEATEYGLNFS